MSIAESISVHSTFREARPIYVMADDVSTITVSDKTPVPVKDLDPEVPTIKVSDTPPVPVKDPDPEVPPKFLYQEPPGTANSWMMENDKNEITLKQHFKDFSGNTSLHGLQYVGEDGRNWFERYYFLSTCQNHICTLRSKSLYLNPTVWSKTALIHSSNVREGSYEHFWNRKALYFHIDLPCLLKSTGVLSIT